VCHLCQCHYVECWGTKTHKLAQTLAYCGIITSQICYVSIVQAPETSKFLLKLETKKLEIFVPGLAQFLMLSPGAFP
jgi:hypothetical protein